MKELFQHKVDIHNNKLFYNNNNQEIIELQLNKNITNKNNLAKTMMMNKFLNGIKRMKMQRKCLPLN